jgi:pimeloyl-ACP methyl ester carboxylesterase
MTFNTAVAHLPDGNTITYMDSGAVEGCQQYTTIVMLHGTAFNSRMSPTHRSDSFSDNSPCCPDVFEPLHALATQYHLRLFAVQRRGYSGSSNYSENELADLQSGNCAFLDRLTVLLGHLIYHLIKKYDLPKPNAERTEGGVALLGWSIGCATSIPFLSDMNVFEPEQYELLRRYIIKLVLYGQPPTHSLGKYHLLVFRSTLCCIRI